MAKFMLELPDAVMKDFKKIHDNAEDIFGAMIEAGAKVVVKNIQANVPESFKRSKIMDCLRLTRIYKTPSDDGINIKVAFYGYFENHNGVVDTPAPLVANVFEYGSSKFKKQPFLRKSFNKRQIQKAMLEAQKEASGGLLYE